MTRLLSIMLILCFSFASATPPFQSGKTHPFNQDEGSDVKVFDKAGKPFAKRIKIYQRPKVIVDTVRVVAGWGQCKLNDRFQRLQHRTAATSALAAYPTVTQLLSDTSKTVYYYAVSVEDNGKRIVIKSSGGTADTGVVVLHSYVR